FHVLFRPSRVHLGTEPSRRGLKRQRVAPTGAWKSHSWEHFLSSHEGVPDHASQSRVPYRSDAVSLYAACPRSDRWTSQVAKRPGSHRSRGLELRLRCAFARTSRIR